MAVYSGSDSITREECQIAELETLREIVRTGETNAALMVTRAFDRLYTFANERHDRIQTYIESRIKDEKEDVGM